MTSNDIPLSLYIHIPWCIRKCPYCDFNSHTLKNDLPETQYVQILLQDLQEDLKKWPVNRDIRSIFFGGGTPSLFSPKALADLLNQCSKLLNFSADIEITLEANPGTVEQQRFAGFRSAGINRLSIGIQSFQNDKLNALGRIHDQTGAVNAIKAAKKAGFDNFNLDLMHGLPGQSVADALFDLRTAIALEPTHLSWYQLTLEPNTAFYQNPPQLPKEEITWDIYEKGSEYLAQHNFKAYEVSAFFQQSNQDFRCRHNLNYWSFGDYLAIGAGAHGKLTLADVSILRFWKIKHPKHYLAATDHWIAEQKIITNSEQPFEFMMNALRLYQPIPISWLTQRTGILFEDILPKLERARSLGLITWNEHSLETTELGKRYLNDLLEIFL